MLIQRARDNVAAVAFCNLVGGQDELVFDGHSLVIDHEGEVLARGKQFAEELILATVDAAGPRAVRLRDPRHRAVNHRSHPHARLLAHVEAARATAPDGWRPLGGPIAQPLGRCAEVYAALTLGLRDYVTKNGFKHVVMGLSGGIDSALVAVIAVDALGPERVSTVIMPSPHSSDETQSDARQLAANLGVEARELPIADAMAAYETTLGGRVRRTRARSDRGEPPGADSRQPADGALQQVRVARADDRQQVRDGGRLLDPVRRQRRRLRRDQGLPEDARLRARAPPQCDRRR